MGFSLNLYAAIATIGIQLVFVSSFDWCSLKCDDETHTMCKYKEGSGECADSLTEAEKRVLLDAHNRLRWGIALGNNTGQPTASNMRMFSWHDEAAMIAQRWADTCPNGNDNCRLLQNKQDLGQNQALKGISTNTTRKDTLESMLQIWYGEIQDMDSKIVNSFKHATSGGDIGHYTQIVWADTYHVGCGMGTTKRGTTNEFYLICNYYPPGNVIKQSVYLEGKSCSKCPAGTECSEKWPGLCSTKTAEADTIPIKADISPAESKQPTSAVYNKALLPVFIICLKYSNAFAY